MEESSLTTYTGDMAWGTPLRLGAGIAIRAGAWEFAVDGRLYLPREEEWLATYDPARTSFGDPMNPSANGRGRTLEGTKPAFSAALGVEHRLSSARALLAGLFYDASARDLAKSSDPFYRFANDRGGITLGYSTHLGPVDTTFGLHVAFESGQSARFAPATRLGASSATQFVDSSGFDAGVFLSGAIDVSFEEAYRQLHPDGEALPSPSPQISPPTRAPEPPSPPPPPPASPAPPSPECAAPEACVWRGAVPAGFQWGCHEGKCRLDALPKRPRKGRGR